MTVSPAVAHIVPRPAPKRAPSIRPVPKPQPRPVVDRRTASALVEVEGDLFEATAELVYQRDDLIEAASPENNRALARALRAIDDRDLVLARELIRVALHLEDREDAAIRRAERRRANAQDHQRAGVGRVEVLLTGRES